MELSLLPIESAPPAPTESTPAESPGSTESAAIATAPEGPAADGHTGGPGIAVAPAAADAAGGAPSAASASDRYLVAATREYESGRVDRPLWERSLELAGGDHAVAVPGYLRARATALRLAGRERSATSSGERKRPSPIERAADAAAGGSVGAARVSDGRRGSKLRGWPIVATVAGVAVAAAMWFLLASRDDAGVPVPASPTAGAAGAPVSIPATPPVAPVAPQVDASAEREAKVQELLRAGNWNVLVLHAAEWTRKEPENAKAWKHLSVGYANLKQTDDALAAAERAAQLAPGEPGTWAQLGRMNLSAGRPEVALHAFEQAVAQDGRDVASWVLVGRVNAELGRLPQAKAAFDRALAVNPEDTDALCGELRLAQKQGRGKDAEATLRELKRGAKECPADAAPAVASMAVVPAASSAPPGRGR